VEILELLDIEAELDKCGNDTDRIVTWVDSYARDVIDAVKELYTSSGDYIDEIRNLKEVLDSREEEIREKDKKVERLNDEISGNIDVITSLNDIIERKDKEIDNLKDEALDLDSIIKRNEDDYNKLEEKYDYMIDEIYDLRAQLPNE
jgi:chromosome segregation ATPase